MEKISINNGEVRYGVESIQPVSKHVMRIVFADDLTEEYGDRDSQV